MTKYWMSCNQLTVQVNEENGVIVWTAPVTRKFVGQPVSKLRWWLREFGGYREEVLT